MINHSLWEMQIAGGNHPGIYRGRGTIAGFALAWAKDWLVGRESRKRQAHYLAARIVCILERYLTHCGDVVHDNGEYDPQGNRHETVRHEPLEPYPDDVDWRSIAPDLMYRILMLPQEIWIARRSISSWAQDAFPPDWDEYYEERKFQYGRVGLYTFNLLNDIRNKYDLPRQHYRHWNPQETFQSAMAKIEELRQAQQSSWPIPPPPPAH